MQGVHLACSAFPKRLRNTELELPDLFLVNFPWDTTPWPLRLVSGGTRLKDVLLRSQIRKDSRVSLAKKDPPEVGPLSRKVMAPYPSRYRKAFAFSGILCPLAYRPALRQASPEESPGHDRVYRVPHR
ncbi:MAG: hypothetical protein ACYC9S_13090 [Leptospirales bacterium]